MKKCGKVKTRWFCTAFSFNVQFFGELTKMVDITGFPLVVVYFLIGSSFGQWDQSTAQYESLFSLKYFAFKTLVQFCRVHFWLSNYSTNFIMSKLHESQKRLTF